MRRKSLSQPANLITVNSAAGGSGKPSGERDTAWINLIAVDALEPDDVTPVPFGDRLLAVYDTRTGVTVSDARCTHAGANLCDGYFDGRNIECPLHQGLFDATTGAAKAAPVVRALQMFQARIHAQWVQILVPVKTATDANNGQL